MSDAPVLMESMVMKSSFLVPVVSVFLGVATANAQTAAGEKADESLLQGKDQACLTNPEKCARAEPGSRMQQAMRAGCAQAPDSCKERHETAAKRRDAAASAPAPGATALKQ